MIDKLRLVQSQDACSITLSIAHEDHTIGNPLRYLIMKNIHVTFCAYSIPHPSEPEIHFRIQTDGEITAMEAFTQGLDDLINTTTHIFNEFKSKVEKQDYELVQQLN